MGGKKEPWIRNDVLAFVVQLSRVVGMAPLVFAENGPRVSLAHLVYGLLLVTVTGGITIWFSLYQGHQSTETNDEVYNAKTTQVVIQWMSYTTLITNFICVSLAVGRMKSLIDIAKRVEMVKAKLDTNHSREVQNKEKQAVVLYYVAFSLFFTIETYFYTKHIKFNTGFIIVKVTQFTKSLMITLTSIQLILTCRYIDSLFPSYNKCVRHLLESIDDKKQTDLIAFRRGFGKVSHIHSERVYVSPRSLNTMIDRLGLFPSRINAEESTLSSLRHLNSVYMEIYTLVDVMNHHHNGITILILLIVHTFNLTVTVYHAANKIITSTPHILLMFEAYWLLHHLTYICLTVDCGHRIIYETAEIKRTVSKLMGKAVFLKDECVEELNKLFVKLTLMEPTLSPLNVCTLSRRLIISIIGAVAAYSLIVVQFRSSEVST